MKVVVDTSALIAILFSEPDEPRFWVALTSTHDFYMSSANYFETSMVAAARLPDGQVRFEALLKSLPRKIALRAVTAGQSRLALKAWLTYGKGRHPAGLNFGDCFSYALAETLNASLLFKGRDFSMTPIRSALS